MDEKMLTFKLNNLQMFNDEGNEGGNPTPAESPEPKSNPGEQKQPSGAKTFTQDELNDVVVKRLAKQEASWLKKFGVEKQEDIEQIIANAKAYGELSPKYEEAMAKINAYETEKATAVYKDVIKKHSDEVDYIIEKVSPNDGETVEDYEKRVNEFLGEHKAFLKSDNSVRINSGEDLSGKGRVSKPSWNDALEEALYK